jgi:hypothetical protein
VGLCGCGRFFLSTVTLHITCKGPEEHWSSRFIYENTSPYCSLRLARAVTYGFLPALSTLYLEYIDKRVKQDKRCR